MANTFCRVCLRADKDVKTIERVFSNLHEELCDYTLFALKPQYCNECEYLLKKMYRFKQRCIMAVKIIKNWKKSKPAERQSVTHLCTLLPPSCLGLWTVTNKMIYTFEEEEGPSSTDEKSDPNTMVPTETSFIDDCQSDCDNLSQTNCTENELDNEDMEPEPECNKGFSDDILDDLVSVQSEASTNSLEDVLPDNGSPLITVEDLIGKDVLNDLDDDDGIDKYEDFLRDDEDDDEIDNHQDILRDDENVEEIDNHEDMLRDDENDDEIDNHQDILRDDENDDEIDSHEDMLRDDENDDEIDNHQDILRDDENDEEIDNHQDILRDDVNDEEIDNHQDILRDYKNDDEIDNLQDMLRDDENVDEINNHQDILRDDENVDEMDNHQDILRDDENVDEIDKHQDILRDDENDNEIDSDEDILRIDENVDEMDNHQDILRDDENVDEIDKHQDILRDDENDNKIDNHQDILRDDKNDDEIDSDEDILRIDEKNDEIDNHQDILRDDKNDDEIDSDEDILRIDEKNDKIDNHQDILRDDKNDDEIDSDEDILRIDENNDEIYNHQDILRGDKNDDEIDSDEDILRIDEKNDELDNHQDILRDDENDDEIDSDEDNLRIDEKNDEIDNHQDILRVDKNDDEIDSDEDNLRIDENNDEIYNHQDILRDDENDDEIDKHDVDQGDDKEEGHVETNLNEDKATETKTLDAYEDHSYSDVSPKPTETELEDVSDIDCTDSNDTTELPSAAESRKRKWSVAPGEENQPKWKKRRRHRGQFSKDRLLAELEFMFSQSEEFKTPGGITIDAEYIMNCVDESLKLTEMKHMWRVIYNGKGKTFTHKALKLFESIQNKTYENEFELYESMFDIERYKDREQVMEGFKKRATYDSYVNAPYKCELCYQGFRNENHLAGHNKRHDESAGAFACEICKARYKSKTQVSAHYMNVHRIVFKCKLCPFVTRYKTAMRWHFNGHKGKSFVCEPCNVFYATEAEYNMHRMSCKDRGIQFVCDLCGRMFSSDACLKYHNILSHKVQCRHCERSFSTETALREHVVEMQTEALRFKQKNSYLPLRCRVCNATGYDKTWLRQHFREVHPTEGMNADLKTHLCDICGKGFSSSLSFCDHMNKHQGLSPYACRDCHKRFSCVSAVRGHRNIHRPPTICPVCGKKFQNKSSLDMHQKIHTGNCYKCAVCDKDFSHQNLLNTHLKDVHHRDKQSGSESEKKKKKGGEGKKRPKKDVPSEVRVECKHCERSFSSETALQEHVCGPEREHTGKLYKCSLCDTDFPHRNMLNGHRKGVHHRVRRKSGKEKA